MYNIHKGVKKMSATTINIDDTTKKEAQELLKDMGMNLSTAVNIFLRQLIKEQRIPFEIGNPRPKQELLSAIKEAEEMEKNPEIGKRYSSVKEMIKDILENEE